MKCLFSPSAAPVWTLMTRALRQAVPEVPVGPRPPRLCPSCWTDSVNAEPAATQQKEPAAPSLCRCIRRPQPPPSDAEPRRSLSVRVTSRSRGPAPASSNRPLRSCLAPPALAPSQMLRQLLRPPPLQPNCPASAPVIPSLRCPRCHASPPCRRPSPLAISPRPW